MISQEQIAEGIFSMWIRTARIGRRAEPGQFLALYCRDRSRLLPRPISICEADRETGRIRLVYRVAGSGTEEFSALTEGDTIDVTGPLGNGFLAETLQQAADPEKTDFDSPRQAAGTESAETLSLLVGGGIGIPPMLELAKRLPGRKAAVLGYKSELFLAEDLRRYADVYIATEDGSAGTKGTVLDAIRENGLKAGMIYACGPLPMLRAAAQYAREEKIPCLVSMEERMACGIGACLSCVCRSAETDDHSRVKNKRICAEGPVFPADSIVL